MLKELGQSDLQALIRSIQHLSITLDGKHASISEVPLSRLKDALRLSDIGLESLLSITLECVDLVQIEEADEDDDEYECWFGVASWSWSQCNIALVVHCPSLESIIVQGRGGDLVYCSLVEGIRCRRSSYRHIPRSRSRFLRSTSWTMDGTRYDDINSFFQFAAPRLKFN